MAESLADLSVVSLWAIIAAAFGAVLAQILQSFLTHRRDRRQRRAELAAGPLWQVQDAAESLWHRLENVKDRDGARVMDDDHFVESTAFLVAQFLAAKRLLGENGIYAQVPGRGKGDELRSRLESAHRQIFRQGDVKSPVLRIHQSALGDLALDRDHAGWYLVTYTEFVGRWRAAANPTLHDLVRDHLLRLRDDVRSLARAKAALEDAGQALSKRTSLMWAGGSSHRSDLTTER